MTSLLLQDTPVQTLRRGLVGYWPLGTGAALNLQTTLSDKPGPYLLTNNGTVASAVGPSANLRGGAQFNIAGTRYLSRADEVPLSVAGTGPFTVACWVYADTLPATSLAFVGKADLLGQAEFLLQWNTANGFFCFICSHDGSTLNLVASPVVPATATWYYIAGWFDGRFLNVQVNNGVIGRVGHNAVIFDSTSPFTIGAAGATPTMYHDGRIAHVGLWRRALTAQERTTLYNSGQGFDLARGC